ncbi:trypsin-like serine protease [Rhizobium laguerreae]|uniref:trypsin-like peptidase domain-containing protein n=1 Tax=Rhizobium laguerreae TaxID=1076926 RepID=UPI001C925741|nr:trypsin-like peptidase domain-containing protein [Rhizobium laguerreae]MBY3258704.1 trypsin-like serine protease [Rhizobium laguerreae]MBY3286541.1 trypsin-like serine protease [Rhizobium laguerreae]MBY3293204.1 trypsin-like serine protease [Rhizobium laguerreae]
MIRIRAIVVFWLLALHPCAAQDRGSFLPAPDQRLEAVIGRPTFLDPNFFERIEEFSEEHLVKRLAGSVGRLEIKGNSSGGRWKRAHCTATLVSPDYVLTANHCVDDPANSEMRVRFGADAQPMDAFSLDSTTDLVSSADGGRSVTVSNPTFSHPIGEVLVLDGYSGGALLRLTGVDDRITAVAIDRRGDQVAIGTEKGSIHFWKSDVSIERVRLVRQASSVLDNAQQAEASVSNDPANRELFYERHNAVLSARMALRELRTDRKTVQVITDDATGPVNHLVFSEDGSKLSAAINGSRALMWEIRPQGFAVQVAAYGPQLEGVPCQTAANTVAGEISAVALDPNGATVAVGTAGGQVFLVDRKSCEVQLMNGQHRAAVTALGFTADATSVTSAGADRAMRTFRVSDGQSIAFSQWWSVDPIRLNDNWSGKSDLDYAVLKILPKQDGTGDKPDVSFAPVVLYGGLAPIAGQELVLVHHPEGQTKRATRTKCRVVDVEVSSLAEGDSVRYNTFGHRCDTRPGSSGAMLFSEQYELAIGLHQAGVGMLQTNIAKRLDQIIADSPILQTLAVERRPPTLLETALGRLVAADSREAASEPTPTVGYRDRALILAAWAHALTPGPDADSALLAALDMPVALIGYLYHAGAARVTSVAFDAGGQPVTTADNGTLAIHPLPIGSAPSRIQDIGVGRIVSVAARRTHRLVHALGGEDGRIAFCAGDRCVAAETPDPAPTTAVTSVAIAPSGSVFASGLGDGRLLIHRWVGNNGRARLEQVYPASIAAIQGLAFDVSGRWLVATSQVGEVLIWDLSYPSAHPVRVGKTGTVLYHVDVDMAERRLFTGGGAGDVRIWDLGLNEALPEPLDLHRDTILHLVRAGQRILATDATGQLIDWNLKDQQAVANVLRRGPTDIWRLELTPDETRLAAIDDTGEITVWDIDSSAPQGTVIGKHDKISLGFNPILAFDASGQRLLSGGAGGEVVVWDISRRNPIRGSKNIVTSGYRIHTAAVQADRLAMVPISQPDAVLVADADTTELIRRFKATKGSISSVGFDEGALLIAYAHGDGFVTVGEVSTGLERCTVRLAAHPIWTVQVNGAGSVIAAYRGDLGLHQSEIHVATCGGQRPTDNPMTLVAKSERPTALALTDDGATLFSGHDDGQVFAWDMTGRAPTPILIAHLKSAINTLAYNERTSRLIVGNSQGEMLYIQQLGEGLSFADARHIGVHSGYITQLAVSPDGTSLAAVDINNKLGLWHVPTSRPVHMLRESIHHETRIGYSASGDVLRGMSDGKILWWNMNQDDWAKLTCKLANRSLTPVESLSYPGLESYADPCLSRAP